MPTNLSHPLAQSPPGLLDLTPTLWLRAGIGQSEMAALPPLSFLLLADRLAELYEMVFPDQPDWLEEEIGHWRDEEDVAAAVAQFLQRVNALFPVHDDIWDMDLEIVEWRLYEIPVTPLGYDIWYDDWQDLAEPAAYLLHMYYSREDADNPLRCDAFADLYPALQTPRFLQPHRLVRTLREMTLAEPLHALPDLIEMLDHNTGNVWLDVGELSLMEGGGYPSWSQEELAWLTETWREAQPVWARVRCLLDWQNGSAEEIGYKLTAVRAALLEAYRRAQSTGETDAST